MSTAGVMVCRDAADCIETVVRHLLWHTDEVIVADHRSVDGTREILETLPVTLIRLDGRGFPEDETRTAVIRQAWEHGHDWVLYNDADEIWYPDGLPDVRVSDWLAEQTGQRVISGELFDHVASVLDDPDDVNPVTRLGWRKPEFGCLKGVFRTAPDAGYSVHTATYGGVVHPYTGYGLKAHHYSVRSEQHLISKVRNGLDSASVEAGMPPGYDIGWAQWKGLTDDELRAAYYERFYSTDPIADGLVYDPAPVKR